MRRVSYRHVGYSRSEQRRDRRYDEPSLYVSINGVKYQTADFSLGGLRLKGVPGKGAVDDQVELAFDGVRNGKRWTGQAKARVVNVDRQHGECGMAFVNLPDASFVALESLMIGSRRRSASAATA